MENIEGSMSKRRRVPITEDPSTLITRKRGQSFKTFQIAQLFENYSSDEQLTQAKTIADNYKIKSLRKLLACMTDPEAKRLFVDYLNEKKEQEKAREENATITISQEVVNEIISKLLDS